MKRMRTHPFVSGGTYRHISTLDVDICVDKLQYKDSKRVKLRISYFHRKYKYFITNNMGLLYTQTVEIKKKDYWKWSRIHS